MHHRIVIIILARFKGFNIAFIAPPFIIPEFDSCSRYDDCVPRISAQRDV